MQRPIARTSLALLSLAVVALLGCERQTSDPLGPGVPDPVFDHSKGHKGDKVGGGGKGGGKDAATVTLAVAMETPAGQPQAVNIEKDNKHDLLLSGSIEIKLDFSMTIAAAIEDPTSCTISAGDDETKLALLNRFADAFQLRNFAMHVDKSALGEASDHNIVMSWVDDGDSREFRGGVESGNVGGNIMVTATDNPDGSTTYTFTGGQVGIRDETGTPAENVTLHCPNLDTVEVTVVK